MSGKVQVVVGGQYGSEGKGAVAGKLAALEDDLVAVRVAGPNAGHTVYDELGRSFVLQQIPVAAVTNKNATLVIAAGSEIDPDLLRSEINKLEGAGIAVEHRLFIDSQATVLTKEHAFTESEGKAHGEAGLTQQIGSTGKGIGAARAARALRKAELWPEGSGDTGKLIRESLLAGACVQVEGTQGYGLGLHAGHYPYCTSSDCRAVDFMAMAGISPWSDDVDGVEVWIVCRTFPIRVAGNSGPMFEETSWAELHNQNPVIPEFGERTTVTKKVRRVGQWDEKLVKAAVEANGGENSVNLALTFLDYKFPELANKVEMNQASIDWVNDIEGQTGAHVGMVGTGPATYFTFQEAAAAMRGNK